MIKKIVRFLVGLANMTLVLALAVALQLLLRGRAPDLVVVALSTVLLLALYLAGARWIERRKATELQFSGAAPGIGAGLALGMALFSSVMGILWVAGAYRPTGMGTWQPLGIGFLLAGLAAVFEEVAFRGFLFRLIANLGGNWIAIVVTSALFGLAHMANPHATLASAAAIAIEAGILLGAVYAASGALWLPIGLHAGWNFAEGPVFGMAVSGNAHPAGLIAGNLRGAPFLTGGEFGPEASVVAVAICLAAAIPFLFRLRPAGAGSSLPLNCPPAQHAAQRGQP